MTAHHPAPDIPPSPPHQAPPWKIALPFVVFIGIVLGTYAVHRQPLALVAVALAAVMGGVGTYGAWRACRDDARVAACLPFTAPVGTTAVVISRARRGGWGSPVGYLLATETALVWTLARAGWRAGDTVAGRAPAAPARSGRDGALAGGAGAGGGRRPHGLNIFRRGVSGSREPVSCC
jgi:hypothetical protein